MAKIIYAALFLAVWYGGVNGDAACFLQKMSECAQKIAVKIPPQDHDFILCKFKEELFTCIRGSAVECSVGQRYNFDHFEKVYNDFCRDGSVLNLEMKKHKECIYNTLITSLSCAQDIIDFAKHIKEFTPEVILELGKLTCRERTNINECYFRNIHQHCGESAKDVFRIYTGASEHLNELICKDILNE